MTLTTQSMSPPSVVPSTVQETPTSSPKCTDSESHVISTLQSAIRTHLEQVELNKKKEAIRSLQSAIRTNLTQLEYRKNSAPYFFRTLKDLDSVENGYGEYIVFRTVKEDDEIVSKPIDKETYDLIYPLLQAPIQEKGNRYNTIREQIKKVDPSLEIAFIPRTLYELIFIRAGIQEEVQDHRICLSFSAEERQKFESACKKENPEEWVRKKLENCWHITHFDDEHPASSDHPHVKLLAWRLNNLLVQEFNPIECLSGTDIAYATKKEIRFFRSHANKFEKGFDDRFKKSSLQPMRGPTVNFAVRRPRLDGYMVNTPMVMSDKSSEIIKNSVGLECSPLAHNRTILYRGGNLERDRIIKDESIHLKSLSYGTSLLSGALFDGGATVLCYGTDEPTNSIGQGGKEGRPIYALTVSPSDYRQDDSVFHIPEASAVCKLTAEGEFFHGRTRTVGVSETAPVEGVYSIGPRPRDLSSSLEPVSFRSKLNQHHVKLIALTPIKSFL